MQSVACFEPMVLGSQCAEQAAPVEWQFLQCFGERTPGEEVQDGESLDQGKKAGGHEADSSGGLWKPAHGPTGFESQLEGLVEGMEARESSVGPYVSTHPSCFERVLRVHAPWAVLGLLCTSFGIRKRFVYLVLQLMSSLLWSLMPMGHTWQLGTRGAGWCSLRRCQRCR